MAADPRMQRPQQQMQQNVVWQIQVDHGGQVCWADYNSAESSVIEDAFQANQATVQLPDWGGFYSVCLFPEMYQSSHHSGVERPIRRIVVTHR